MEMEVVRSLKLRYHEESVAEDERKVWYGKVETI
jgi:hypothetical protein